MNEQPPSQQLKFWEHLEELRKRLILSIVGIVIGSIAGLIFSKQILDFLTFPFYKSFPAMSLVVISPVEGFSVYMMVGIAGGITVTIPWVFYQIWGFVSPALRKSEKKTVLPLVLISTFLFLIGSSLAWWILPRALNFLGQFSVDTAEVFWSLDTYVTFVVLLAIAFGLMFQLPLITSILIRLGIASQETFQRQRRIAYIIILVVSAVITPTTDIFTLSALTIPLIIMYELSIIIGSIWRKSVLSSQTNVSSNRRADV